jgi:tetratricopeptide (TPR) repeat protein
VQAGQTLSHYRLLEIIGEGGMGQVWKAQDTALDREVAIKVLPDTYASDPERLARFEREARAAARLSHPNIVQIHDFGSEAGVTYAVVELLVGQNLRDRLSETTLGWRKAVEIGVAIAEGMAAAHAQGVIHRDLKPGNVFITRDGQVKILDFGIARIETPVSADSATQTTPADDTGPGRLVGTVGYMSPEQVRAETIDARTDIFSFGCVIYEMLAGQRAFSGKSGVETMAAILREEPPEISSTDAALPGELSRIVQRSLAKNPEERFQSAGDLAFALRSLLSEGALPQPQIARPRGATRWWIGAAALIIVLAVVAIWWVGRRTEAPTQTIELDPNRVVVAVFENRTADAGLDQLGPMASDWITQGLSQTGVVEVVPSMTTLLSIGVGQPGPDALRTYSEQSGAGIVVSGVYYLREEEVLFQATVTDATQGKVVHSFQPIHGDRINPMPAIEELRQRVMGFMVTRESPYEGVRLFGNAPKFEAYQEYIAGAESFGRDDERAILHLEKAAELDPTLYSARLFLAYLYGINNDSEKAGAVLQGLLDDLEKMSPYEQFWFEVMLANSQRRYFEVLRLLQEAEKTWPTDLLLKDWIGIMGLYLNRPQLVVDTMAGADPDRVRDHIVALFWHDILATAYHLLGQHQLELETVRIAVQWYPDMLNLRYQEASAAAAMGDLYELDRIIEETLAIKPADEYHAGDVLLGAARELRVHGYPTESATLANRAVNWCQGRLSGSARSDQLREFLARALYHAERWTESRDLFRQLAREDPGNVDYQGFLGVLAARMGDEAGAHAVLNALQSIDQPEVQAQVTVWRARITALLGDKDGAMTLLRQAVSQGTRFGVRIHRDVNFEPLWDYPPFQELVRPKG